MHFTWEKVAKRITDLIQKGRYLTEQEQAEYDKIQEEKALAEEDALQAQQPTPEIWEYNGVKERHPDDMVLYQMGDFFELYGEDAKTAAAELGFNLQPALSPAVAVWKCAAFRQTGWNRLWNSCGIGMM